MLAVSTNNAVVFLNAPGDCGTGTYNVIVTYTNTFQDGTSATNPYMIPNWYRLIVVYLFTLTISYVMEICIHHENIPRKKTIISEGYFFKTNNLSVSCARETTSKCQIALIANTDFATSANFCFTFDVYVTPNFPNCSWISFVLGADALCPQLYYPKF